MSSKILFFRAMQAGMCCSGLAFVSVFLDWHHIMPFAFSSAAVCYTLASVFSCQECIDQEKAKKSAPKLRLVA